MYDSEVKSRSGLSEELLDKTSKHRLSIESFPRHGLRSLSVGSRGSWRAKVSGRRSVSSHQPSIQGSSEQVVRMR